MKVVHILLLILLLAVRVVSSSASSNTVLRGLVVDAVDGETITLDVDRRLVKIRLCAVTAPKNNHSFAPIARSHLSLLSKGKQAQVEYNGLDRDGIIIGVVTIDQMDVGLQMIRDGAALYNRAYEGDVPIQSRHLYDESEKAAQAESRGIWQSSIKPSIAELDGNRGDASETGASASEIATRLNDEAYALIQQQNYRAALPKIREALRLNPNLADAHKNLALIFSDTGRYLDAVPEGREAIRLRPDSEKAHNVLGKVLLGLKDYDGAIHEFKEAVRLSPRYAKAVYNLGVAYQAAGQFSKSLTTYLQAETLAPNDAAVQLNMGIVLLKLGKRAEARARWTRVLKMGDPVAATSAEQNLAHF